MSITRIDRPTCKTISDKAEQALKVLADELGMTLTREAGRFSADSLTVKMTFKVVGSNGVSKVDTSAATALGLPSDVIGRRFVAGRTTYTVTGINLRRPKYPVSGTGPKGGRYKFTTAQVQGGLVA
jgi:hypothetical protein